MSRIHRLLTLWLCAPIALALGCGTTRWSDTTRTATEQMLMSDAIERSVSELDFNVLAGHDVFLEGKYIAGMVDEKYVLSTLRQHVLASGCVVRDKAEDADYIVEIRAGALGTNRNDVLFGVPATNLPAGGAFIGAPSAIPELPLIKRTAQQGVCKLAVFAYDRTSGAPVWQSGTHQQISRAKDVWVFGTGPIQHGTIYDGAKFAGEKVKVPLTRSRRKKNQPEIAAVTRERTFMPPSTPPNPKSSDSPRTAPAATAVAQASASGTPAPTSAAAAPGAAPTPNATPATTTTPAASTTPASVSSSGNGTTNPNSATTSATTPTNGTATPALSTTSQMPNAAAGAMGAYQVADWARSMHVSR